MENDTDNPEYLLNHITKYKGVIGYVIFDNSGVPVKSSGMDSLSAASYSTIISEFNIKVKRFLNEEFVNQLLPPPDNELQVIRLRTKKNEIIITPHSKYTLIVIFDPFQLKTEVKNNS